jgi:lipopolysaccharide export system permease protein
MILIERYIFRIALAAFVASLLALTAVIWITQALRELDLITGKGQTILMFMTVTGLSLPTLIAVISPVALFIATLHALNRLNSDSELIVMSAAGLAPLRLLRPFLALAAMVAVLVGVLTIYVMPASFQELRDLITRIRADFVANIAKEGQFTKLDNGVTFHFRERAGEALLGIFMQDRREEGRTTAYLAERGRTATYNGQSYLVLENGSVHRQQANAEDSSIVAFERYAIDLSALSQEASEVVYKPRERSTLDLVFPDKGDFYYQYQAGRFRSELHTRLSAWLIPLAMMFVGFVALGEVRTTRQGRGLAVAVAVVAVLALRIAVFFASTIVVRSPSAIYVVYGLPLATMALCLAMIVQGPRLRAALAGLGHLGAALVRVPRLARTRA